MEETPTTCLEKTYPDSSPFKTSQRSGGKVGCSTPVPLPELDKGNGILPELREISAGSHEAELKEVRKRSKMQEGPPLVGIRTRYFQVTPSASVPRLRTTGTPLGTQAGAPLTSEPEKQCKHQGYGGIDCRMKLSLCK